jgi:hypothetical protein
MSHQKKIVYYLLTLTALVGCASGHIKSESRVQATEVPRVQRLLINLNIESRNFNQSMVAGVEESLKKLVSQCGISSQFIKYDPLDLRPMETQRNIAKNFRPDAVLNINRTGGQVLRSQGGNQASFDIMLRLRNSASNTEYWTAKSDVQILTANMFIDDRKSGQRLGERFFELMKSDRVICQ